MSLVSLETDLMAGRGFANEHLAELGHVLPISEKIFREYFPADRSFLFYRARRLAGIFSTRSGRDKHSPTAILRLVADSPPSLEMMLEHAERAALAHEKHVIQTGVFGYEEKKIAMLKSLGVKVGATLPGCVSLDGRRYDYNVLYRDLTRQYRFPVRRRYAGEGLYTRIEVDKAKDPQLSVRGYRKEDRPIIDKFASHDNVIRGIGSGIFPGLLPWVPGMYDQFVEAGRVVPLVCEDKALSEPVGILDLWRPVEDVMQHSAMLGMLVRAEYQGMGVGGILMDSMKRLAQRMHLARVWLTVYEGNEAAQRLYRKVGFEECGKIPGWFLEGYVNEIFMTLKLD